MATIDSRKVTAAQVDNVPAGDIAATDVQAALNELDVEKTAVADLASTANGDGASLVGIEDAGGNFAATTVEGALAEVAGTAGVTSVFTRSGDVVATTSDYDANQVDNTPAGNIAATDVQAAIDELDSEKTAVADLASTANTEGASLVGVEDVAGNFTSIQVEATLAEIALQIKNLGLATSNQWNFSTVTADADPGSGNFRANNSTPASITQLFVNNVNNAGVDVKLTLLGFVVGDSFYLQQLDDSSKFLHIELTVAPIDATTYVKFTVTILDSGTLYDDGSAVANFQQQSAVEAVDVSIEDTGGFFTAVEVETALQELGQFDSDLSSTANGLGASRIGIEDVAGDYTATDVEAALAEIGGAAPVDSVHGRTGAVVSATSDYDAIQVDNTPAGDIAATNVQAAIDELDSEKTSAATLASTANGDGASLVGVEDSAGNYASTEVEATLAEISTLINNLALATANQWRFSTSTVDADPTSGRFRANNATPASITQLFISNVNQEGVDISVLLLNANPGDVIYIQETAVSANFLLVQLSADPIDATTYVKWPVTILDSGTLFTNNRDCSFITQVHETEAVDISIDDAGGFFTGTEVEAALQELGQSRADLSSTANGDGASLIGIEDVAGDYAGTTVEAALAEIGGAAPVDSVFSRTGAVVAATSDYDAVQVDNTPAGDIAATNVQAAIDELDSEKTSVADLASTANGDGASLVGIEDTAGEYTSTDAEAAFAEIAARMTTEEDKVFKSFQFYAAQLDTPTNSDWPINVQAGRNEDTNNAALSVLSFDDTVEQGVGFELEVPDGAVNMKIKYRTRAETTPGGAVIARWNLRERGLPDNAAVEAFSAATQLADSDYTTNEFFRYDEDERTIASWGLTAGQMHQFEFTRDATDGSDTLVGDATLLAIIIEFTQ